MSHNKTKILPESWKRNCWVWGISFAGTRSGWKLVTLLPQLFIRAHRSQKVFWNKITSGRERETVTSYLFSIHMKQIIVGRKKRMKKVTSLIENYKGEVVDQPEENKWVVLVRGKREAVKQVSGLLMAAVRSGFPVQTVSYDIYFHILLIII